MNKLQNKVAIVTGVSKGIGASIAKHLAAEGAAVVVNYASSKQGADRVVAEIAGNGGKAIAVPANVRVNSINPGMVVTEGVHAAGFVESDFQKELEARTPLGRIGQPQDIAPAAVFLASADSSWITGETLYISGGLR